MGGCQSRTDVVAEVTVESSTKLENGDVSPASQNGTFEYHHGTCALEYWAPVRLLDEGSISSIHLVVRRPHRVDVPYRERLDVMSHACCDSPSMNLCAPDQDEVYALKSIIKAYVRNDTFLQEMRNEIYTMSHLNHPNIATVYEAYERKRHIYLIMEYCAGGNLCERQFSEAQVVTIIRKVLLAVEYLHQHNVVHRDIKLENIMFDKAGPDGEVKVIDFGLATRYLSKEISKLTDKVGTLYSMAPQVLQGVYDAKCDIWSIGVVTYILLSGGKKPFWGPPREMPWEERRKIMVDRIMRCEYMKMKHGKWENVSQNAKDFVTALLQLDPKKRPTATEALALPWIVEHLEDKKESISEQSPLYLQTIKLKRTTRQSLAKTLSDEHLYTIITKLKSLESQGDNLSIKGLCTLLSDTVDCTFEEPMKQILESNVAETTIIEDCLGFVVSILEMRTRKDSERMAAMVAEMDESHSGRLTPAKLREALGDIVSKEQLDTILDGHVEADGYALTGYVLNTISQQSRRKSLDFLGSDDDSAVSNEKLATPLNAVIPGGRNKSDRPLYVYDEIQGRVVERQLDP